MIQKKLYIIRHGQTDYNKQGMVQGRGIDAPLNANGKSQAQQFYEAYKNFAFDKLYISELQRTYQSVASFIDDGLPYEKLSGLDEISWGSQEGKPFDENTSKLYHQTVKNWSEGKLEASVGGGESPLDVMHRQQQAIEIIMSQADEKKVLICMHGRAIRILLTWLQQKPLSAMDEIPHTNLGLYEVHVIGNRFKIVRSNDTQHFR